MVREICGENKFQAEGNFQKEKSEQKKIPASLL
jgi:hypothetical protein